MTTVNDPAIPAARPAPTIRRPPVIAWLAGLPRKWQASVVPGVLVAAASIMLHLTALTVLASAKAASVWQRLMPWDADLYRQIAQNGYPSTLTYDPTTHALQGSNLALFPLYPLLERLVHTVIGSWTASALTLSWASMAVALTLLHRLAADLYGPSAVLPAIVLVGCAQPMGIVFALGYPDGGLYLTLGLAAVLCARAKRWLLAGLFASLAGLTRPTGLAVSAVVVAMAAAAWRGSDREDRLFSVAGSLLGCLGTFGYLEWAGLRVHDLGAWFAIQEAGWGTHWDNGAGFWQFLTTIALPGSGLYPMADQFTALIVIGYTVFVLGSARRSRLGVLAVWPVAVLVLTLGQSNDSSVKPRLLLAAGLCLLPAARWLGRVPASVRWPLLVVASLLSAWWGAYMLDIWPWAF